jgi:hypothetical protein
MSKKGTCIVKLQQAKGLTNPWKDDDDDDIQIRGGVSLVKWNRLCEYLWLHLSNQIFVAGICGKKYVIYSFTCKMSVNRGEWILQIHRNPQLWKHTYFPPQVAQLLLDNKH